MEEIITMVLKAILVPLLPLVSIYVTKFVNKYIEKIKQEREINERLKEFDEIDFYLDKVNDIIVTAVKKVNQVFVDDLKKTNNFSKEKQQEAFQKALDIVMELVTEEGQLMVEKAHTDYLAYVENKIEELVNDLKQ